MNMIVFLTILYVLMTFVGQGHAVILTINPVAANVTVLTGNEPVQLNCTSDTPTANIQWIYNGIALPPNHATITTDPSNIVSTLTLIDPTPDKSGEYSCFVPFILEASVSTTLNIFAPIYLINSSPRISALVGDTVTMRVSSLGLGQHALRWSRRGRNVIKGDATGVNTVQLTLPNISVADAGRYFFTATTQWSTNRTRVDLTVTYPPADIVEQPQNSSVFVTLSATFRCDASSPYPVTYSWRRVNSALDITDQATGRDTGTLVIPSVQHSDEGWYQCVASVFDVEAFSEPAYLAVKELPPLEDLKVEMNLEQNEVMLEWTRPDAEIISSNLTLSYKLFYTVRGVCAVSECQGEMCRVQRRIRSRQNSVTVNQELFPYANYTWLLELTYTNDGLTIERYNITVDAQTSQSGASAPVNLTVLNQSFSWVNLTWTTPQCPNGVISGYRVFYNGSSVDVDNGIGHYMLTGLTANTVYNISVAAITGENSDIIGDYISIITMTSLGAPEIEPQVAGMPVAVTRNVTRGTIEVRTPPVNDDQGNISFIYIIVSTDGLVRPDKSTENLAYLEATHSGLVYYVAAALSYEEYSDSNTFTLGDTKITTGLNGEIFNNVKLNTDTSYYYFIRVYSLYYNEQNDLVSTSTLFDIGGLPSVTTDDTATVNDDDDDFPVTIAIVVLAGLVAMIVVLVCIIIMCCCYIISRNNRNRHNILRDLQKAAINVMKEDTMDSGASAKTNNTSTAPKAVPNQYTELLASITDKDAQPYAEVHHNNGGMAVNGSTRAASNSPCSVTSDDAHDKINPALGISEEKEKATIEEKERTTNSTIQETDLPSQEAPQYINVSDKSTPKKESKHSWFSFHSRKKSKSEETKAAQSDHGNPLFDQKEGDNEETGYVDIVIEQTDNTAETSGYIDVVREAPQDTKEEPGYTNVTNTTEEVPGYGNISLELTHSKTTDTSSNSITQTFNSNEENA